MRAFCFETSLRLVACQLPLRSRSGSGWGTRYSS